MFSSRRAEQQVSAITPTNLAILVMAANIIRWTGLVRITCTVQTNASLGG